MHASEYWNDKDLVLLNVKENGHKLFFALERLKKDKEVVLTAVQTNGRALQYASKKLRNNKKIVLTAVQEDGWALEFASKKLTKDKDVVLAAVQKTGWALQWASEQLRNDKQVVLAAVQKDSYACRWASETLKNDNDILSWELLPQGQKCWRKVRERYHIEPILEYWQKQTMKATFDTKGEAIMQGSGAKRARKEFKRLKKGACRSAKKIMKRKRLR